ncbi:hypothetical protein ACF08M_13745 [Streptomyces sp. NPDC015032]|uniref:hypothetical protein n=1 Tax=Streptomyces sp. NPDC015032 TaxID=3364937 RepID=UPI0037014BE5
MELSPPLIRAGDPRAACDQVATGAAILDVYSRDLVLIARTGEGPDVRNRLQEAP